MQPRRQRKTEKAPAPVPRWQARAAALGESRLAYVLASALLLVPCYWQSRLQAGDLSSHIYNAWLAELIAKGQAPGLAIARQATNVLFDLMLGGLLPVAGAEWAQRIAVSVAVLVFVWGAFAFVSAVAGRRAWHMLPVIVMLAYGWVFHIGFFNFYLSLGLCFGALALLWRGTFRHAAAAVPVLALACLAHALPVAWAVCLLVYARLAGRTGPRNLPYLAAGAVLAILLLRVAIGLTMPTRWYPTQLRMMTGLDQVWVFDSKYQLVQAALLLVWVGLAAGLVRRRGVREIVTGIPFQFCLLTALGILMLPTAVLIPGYKHAVAFIAERMSLGLAICVCALLGAARVHRIHHYLSGAAALLFFAFLFRDERILNAAEDQMSQVVAQLPFGQRVIGALDDPDLRVNALTHMIDRVCVGRCFSFANYEPSTAQFRVRVTGDSPIIASTYEQSWLMQVGRYVVRERDLPLYEVNLDQGGQMVLLSLPAGAACGITSWNPL